MIKLDKPNIVFKDHFDNCIKNKHEPVKTNLKNCFGLVEEATKKYDRSPRLEGCYRDSRTTASSALWRGPRNTLYCSRPSTLRSGTGRIRPRQQMPSQATLRTDAEAMQPFCFLPASSMVFQSCVYQGHGFLVLQPQIHVFRNEVRKLFRRCHRVFQCPFVADVKHRPTPVFHH